MQVCDAIFSKLDYDWLSKCVSEDINQSDVASEKQKCSGSSSLDVTLEQL